jgi:hypothetical protein
VVEAKVATETWIADDGKPKPLAPPYGPGSKRPWGLKAPYIGAWYELEVLRSFKGNAPHHLRLFSENSTARFWLDKGRRYFLFVGEERFDPPIGWAATIDTCGNSKSVDGTGGLLRTLERLGAR